MEKERNVRSAPLPPGEVFFLGFALSIRVHPSVKCSQDKGKKGIGIGQSYWYLQKKWSAGTASCRV
jgi:hypothetical protein